MQRPRRREHPDESPEIKIGGVLVPIIQMIAAQGGGGPANKATDYFIEQGEPVSLVCTEGLEGMHGVGIRGFIAIGIHCGAGSNCLPSRLSCWTRPMAMTEVAQSITTG